MKNLDESKYGFWGVLARKAKSILEDDNVAQQLNKPGRAGHQTLDIPSDDVFHQSYQSPESSRKTDNPSLQKGLDAITSSLNYIGGTIGKSFEEGLTIVENRTADIIQETRKLHIRKKGGNLEGRTVIDVGSPQQQVQMQTDQEMQLKASRDVAMAMTAKAKLLLRELKTVKADLAFAKERCNQLEEENRILRESREKGDRPEDDDLIRLQLETLLAEKARLAHENSIYARENRFLREIVEYHQLTMQDVVYLDEGIEEVTEVYPVTIPAATGMWPTLSSPPPPPPMLSSAEANDISAFPTARPVDTAIPAVAKGTSATPLPPPVGTEVPPDAVQSSSSVPVSAPEI
ncbi:Cyclin-dependent kinase 12 isoform x2 [Thalictrum thalictroides]|uniref:Cyclin-dependent kinase 12 isoform x2 n=1 Tax=Thalictrum thalictroides TaxID=46969 RepID=A0A7J6UTW8_THATH|nr:Cyclin-dependent kinase 12 isoform x2 [Thalictrum thalictroides]